MNRFIGAMSLILGIHALALAAIPSQINYQGALKDNGAPANGSRTMSFRVTNQDGTTVYWSSPNLTVPVRNGLFSVQIQPSGVDWETVTPYLEVSVEGQQLSPREALSSGVYAYVAGSVVNGAITPAKVAGGYGLVPAGMIGMFAGPCPAGWSAFSALDGVFPRGGSSYGATGGSPSHSHTLLVTQTLDGGGASVVGTARGGDGSLLQFPGPGGFRVDARSAATDAQPTLPPYLTVVYCQKQ